MALAILFLWSRRVDALEISYFYRFAAYSQATHGAIARITAKRIQTSELP
jgi:hypothetical protein